MLSYRHSFHAGNHADVLKHCTLALIIESLKEKYKGFVYHDTHSGAGRYDLSGGFAEKTGEYRDGVGRLWGQELPESLRPYMEAVRAINSDDQLRFYPGSPKLASLLLRPQDRLLLTELHSTDFPLLKQELADDKRAKVYQQDGYQQLKASMPPKERRGVVLIDPPYELSTEYDDAVEGVLQGLRRWATGIYAIWYPVVMRQDVEKLERLLKSSGTRKILQIELRVSPDTNARGMTGSGLFVINPPWKLESQMSELLPWLAKRLAQHDIADYRLDWLVPE